MGFILSFLRPTPKKFILSLFFILLPWFGLLVGLIFPFPSFFSAFIVLWSLFGLVELPLQFLNDLFNLNLPRGCGGGIFALCMLSSSVQGKILISLIYGFLGYLFSSILIQIKNKLLAIGLVILILVGLTFVLIFTTKKNTSDIEKTRGIYPVNSCTQDSDCLEGLVCVGRGPTKPSVETPGVCLPSKASQSTY